VIIETLKAPMKMKCNTILKTQTQIIKCIRKLLVYHFTIRFIRLVNIS